MVGSSISLAGKLEAANGVLLYTAIGLPSLFADLALGVTDQKVN